MDYKIILSAIGIIIGLVGYFPYYRDILKGSTKPHAFSWLGWCILELIGFFAQLHGQAGAGAWVTGTSCVFMLGIIALSFRYGEKDIKFFDYLAFAAGLIGIILWQLTSNPLTAVILVTLADACMFIPTYRKAWNKPREETLMEYFLSSVKWVFGTAALQNYSLITALYPISLILTNGVFVLVMVLRRKIRT